jgi:hypothetical protein
VPHVPENKVLNNIFEPRSDEVKEEWRISQNELLDDLYSSPVLPEWL